MTNPPLLIGLTGGIGSGKSTVAKIFELFGIPVYYADDRAKRLMANDPKLVSEIKQAFGDESYLEDGQVNRSFLSKIVFSDSEKVKIINSLVHPAVADDFSAWASTQKTTYVLKEAALIFETSGEKKLDFVINVSAPLKIRMARVLARDVHRSKDQVNQIINQQLPDDKKNELADFLIKNVDNKLLIPQVLKIHEKLLNQSKIVTS